MADPELSSAAPVSFDVPPHIISHPWQGPPAAQERATQYLASHWQVAGRVMADLCGDPQAAETQLAALFEEWQNSTPQEASCTAFAGFLGARAYEAVAAAHPVSPGTAAQEQLSALDGYLISRGALLAPLFETPSPLMTPTRAAAHGVVGGLLRSCAGSPPQDIIPAQPAGVSADAPRLTAALVSPALTEKHPLLAAVAAHRQPWRPLTSFVPDHHKGTLTGAALSALDCYAKLRASEVLGFFNATFNKVAPVEKATHAAVAESEGLVKPLPSTLAFYLSGDRCETTFPCEEAVTYLQLASREAEAKVVTCADVATRLVFAVERDFLEQAYKRHEELGRSLIATLGDKLTISGQPGNSIVIIKLTDGYLNFSLTGPSGTLATFRVTEKGKAPLKGGTPNVQWRAPDFEDAKKLESYLRQCGPLLCSYDVNLNWGTILAERYPKQVRALAGLFGGPESLNSDLLNEQIFAEPNNFAVRTITTRATAAEEAELLGVAAEQDLPGLTFFWNLSKVLDLPEIEGVLRLKLPFVPPGVTPEFGIAPDHPYSKLAALQRVSLEEIQAGLSRLGRNRLPLPLELQAVYGQRNPLAAINYLHENGLPVVTGPRTRNLIANVTGLHYAVQALQLVGYPWPSGQSYANVLNRLQSWQQELAAEAKRLGGSATLADTPGLTLIKHGRDQHRQFADAIESGTPVTLEAEMVLLEYVRERNPTFAVDGRPLGVYQAWRAITEPLFAIAQAAGLPAFQRAMLPVSNAGEQRRPRPQVEQFIAQLPAVTAPAVGDSGVNPAVYAQVLLLGDILTQHIQRLRQSPGKFGDPFNAITELQAQLPDLPAAITDPSLKEVYTTLGNTMRSVLTRPLTLPFVLTSSGLALEIDVAPQA